jgi:hypothetical protein
MSGTARPATGRSAEFGPGGGGGGAVIFVAHKQSAPADTFEDFLGLDPTVNHYILVANYASCPSDFILFPNAVSDPTTQFSVIKRIFWSPPGGVPGENLVTATQIVTQHATGDGPGHSITHLVRGPAGVSGSWTMITNCVMFGAGFLSENTIGSIWDVDAFDLTSIRVQRADSAAFGSTAFNWYLYKVLEA